MCLLGISLSSKPYCFEVTYLCSDPLYFVHLELFRVFVWVVCNWLTRSCPNESGRCLTADHWQVSPAGVKMGSMPQSELSKRNSPRDSRHSFQWTIFCLHINNRIGLKMLTLGKRSEDSNKEHVFDGCHYSLWRTGTMFLLTNHDSVEGVTKKGACLWWLSLFVVANWHDVPSHQSRLGRGCNQEAGPFKWAGSPD
jgi:hypothetical protein